MLHFERNQTKAKLADDLVAKIQPVQDAAARKLGSGEFDEAIQLLENAWEMLPAPRLNWDYSVSILRNLCITCVRAGQYETAKRWHNKLLKSPIPKMDSMPFQLGGTIYYHLGDLDKAYEFLQLNYEVGGKFVLKLLEPEIRKFYLDRAAKA